MARPRGSGDARDIITPDSFAVAPELIGWPLARPWRRALAMLIDVSLIGALSLANGLFLGLAVGVVLLRVAFRARWKASTRWVRRAFGCAGVLILLTTVTAVWLTRLAGSGNLRIPIDSQGLSEAGISPSEMSETLEGIVGDSTSGRIDRALSAAVGALDSVTPPAALPPLDTLLARYRAARAGGDSAASAGVRDSLVDVLAGGFLAARDRRIARLERERGELRRDLDRVGDELSEARKPPGILRLVRGIVGDLGLGFGWSGVYFTAFLAMWRGQTPGKRLLGVRVLRLNGRPIGWWIAFERFGGYAASVFTGLLGFLQILWDRNRQGVHDKLTETVVVRVREGYSSPGFDEHSAR